jgi:hypothetical protein
MSVKFASKALVVSAFAVAATFAPVTGIVHMVPAAHADPIPNPEPEPVPAPQESGAVGGSDECGPGLDRGADGNCIPITASAPDETPVTELAPRTTQDITTSSESGEPANVVPNINGDSCTGYWQSVACYEMDQDNVAVQPRSTLSSSP